MNKTYDFNIDGNVVALTPNTEPKSSAPKHPKENRTRRFALTSYIDPTELFSFLKRTPWIQHWAMCTHDKDTLDDGSLKEKHTHVLLYTYEAKTSSSIRKNFDRLAKEVCPEEPQNTLCQEMHDTVKMWRYLRHLDNPEKYQYPEEARICNDKCYWQKYEHTDGLNDSAKNTGFAMFNDMLNGTSTRDMILRYGKEYIYHAHSFKECYIDHIREDNKALRYMTEDSIDARDICETAVLMRNELNGSYTTDELQSFEKMVVHALNNLSILEGVKIVVIRHQSSYFERIFKK